jgi:N4-gp56 family major capsid protein
MKFDKIMLLPVMLNLFDGNTNITGDSGLSDEMKTYYSDYLIDMAEPELVHDQFGQKHPIPKNGGKTIEFRKYDPLPKALTPLTEGVTPNGQKLSMGVITATVKQYGGFIELSDMLLLTAIDNNLVQATKLLGSQAGRTLDTITREVLNGGTNVQYAEGQVNSRAALSYTDENTNHNLTVNAVRRAVRFLKVMNAPRINGYYAGIIHPDCSYDLMSDPKWVNVKTYSDPEGIYEGEIGRIEGVRFVETSEAKVFHGAGASGRDVYSTLIIGADAYGQAAAWHHQ